MRDRWSVRVYTAKLRGIEASGAGVRRHRWNGSVGLQIMVALCVAVCLALSACRSTATQPMLPEGTYRNDAFHFSVSYPSGWQVNVTPASAASRGIPLHVLITRTASLQTDSSLVSNCSITVLNPHDGDIAAQIDLLKRRINGKDAQIHALSLGGKPGYQEQAQQQEIPGTHASDTHTNYYLLLDDYDYEISTDAISSDNVDAALQSMIASFTITK